MHVRGIMNRYKFCVVKSSNQLRFLHCYKNYGNEIQTPSLTVDYFVPHSNVQSLVWLWHIAAAAAAKSL